MGKGHVLDNAQSGQAQGTEAGATAAPEGRGSLVFIERRSSPRFPALEDQVWTGWWSNPEEFVTTAASLDNISRGGARIMTAIPPEENEQLWIRLAKASSGQALQALVLEVQAAATGSYCVRLAFTSPCPRWFHEIVVAGMEHRPAIVVDPTA
jgi:hypothetical protein